MGSFRKKLFLVYSLTIITLTIAISLPLYLYFNKEIKHNTMTSIDQLTASTASNLSNQLNMFNSITFQLYNSFDYTRQTLADYLILQQQTNEQPVDLKTKQSIENYLMIAHSSNRTIEKLHLYTSSGELFSIEENYVTTRQKWDKSSTFQAADQLQGGVMLLEKKPNQYSLIRQLPWGIFQLGYLESVLMPNTLMDTEKLNSIPGINILIVYKDQVVASSLTDDTSLDDLINKLTLSTLTENYGASQQNGLYIVSQKTEKQDFTILTTVPEHELFQPLRIFRNSMVATVILIITISVAFYYFITKLITRPISSLKQLMNEVDLESNQELMLENKYRLDEFESLRRAFHRMNRRLKATMDEKVHFQTLQLQSYYQVLQAQINPHFLFNMIGVITILADKKDAASVSAISRKMSEFMRYTVSAANSTANLQDELNFTSNYLNLMKSRYMHRLNFQVDVSEQLYSIIIPKLTIQPIVENSIQYGLHDGLEELYIVITGTVSGNDWEISIVDNGKGFSTEVLASLQSNIDSYMEKITKHDLQEKPVLTLGGMGLVSTLVRLRITWGQQFSYTIDNHPQGGARIKLQGNLDLLEDKL